MSAWPALRGATLATGAAVLFGASTPLVQRAGEGSGPFATAALLYLGAGMLGLLLREPPQQEAALRRSDLPRLVAMAALGAVAGPVALAWGLQHTSGTAASLMLALEAVFTVLLARAFYREAIGPRVAIAVALLALGGVVLVLDRGALGTAPLLGLLAVLAATFAWGADNTLSRPLAERDPAQVVLAKSLLGASASGLLGWASGESLPAPAFAAALLGIGALGYGLSLKLYLSAQRAFGAARTGSVFAFAPLIGAGVAIPLGERSLTFGLAAGGLLMLAGVLAHLSERHEHEHEHDLLEHEHAHDHADGHHLHTHDPMPTGPHSHPHRHEPMRHRHAHLPDAHHTHPH